MGLGFLEFMFKVLGLGLGCGIGIGICFLGFTVNSLNFKFRIQGLAFSA